jgi:uncharacterized membrane protein YhaH (DUF805 family)
MTRAKYWLVVLVLWFVGGLILAIVKEAYGDNAVHDVGPWLAFGILMFFWPLASLRLRNAGRKERWSFLVIVPLVNLFAIIAIGILPSRSIDPESKSFENPF